MSQNLDMFLPEINREIQRHAMTHLKDRRPVMKSELGDDVSLIGAAALVFAEHNAG
jgi:predicted NBD/HSP70 family sugar kinase